MKSIFLISVLLTSNMAFANNTCMTAAKLQARMYSAEEENVSLKNVKAKEAFFVEESEGVLYYGVRLNTGDYNVGLNKQTCKMVHINIVTDDM